MKILQKNRPCLERLTDLIWNTNTEALCEHYASLYEHESTHRGRREAVKYLKSLYTMAIQYAMYQEVTRIPFRKCDRDGICKDLKPFKLLLRHNDNRKTKAALAVLRQFELFVLEPSYDISTVTDP
jgi:hypothetical protein